jgi:hypothetical protein
MMPVPGRNHQFNLLAGKPDLFSEWDETKEWHRWFGFGETP